jgi:hypothetical protein
MYYYYDVIPARVLRQWTPAMLANLHYSARRAARKHTDLETEVEVLFIPHCMYNCYRYLHIHCRQQVENLLLATTCYECQRHRSEKKFSGYRNRTPVLTVRYRSVACSNRTAGHFIAIVNVISTTSLLSVSLKPMRNQCFSLNP